MIAITDALATVILWMILYLFAKQSGTLRKPRWRKFANLFYKSASSKKLLNKEQSKSLLGEKNNRFVECV